MSIKKRSRAVSFPAALERACKGLNFVSETDSDVTPVIGSVPASTSAADVLAAIGVSPAKEVASVDAEDFFSKLTAKKEWFSEEQRANAERFKALKLLLEKELGDVRVFREGNIQLKIYVIGLDREGNVAGVKMNAVET